MFISPELASCSHCSPCFLDVHIFPCCLGVFCHSFSLHCLTAWLHCQQGSSALLKMTLKGWACLMKLASRRAALPVTYIQFDTSISWHCWQDTEMKGAKCHLSPVELLGCLWEREHNIPRECGMTAGCLPSLCSQWYVACPLCQRARPPSW